MNKLIFVPSLVLVLVVTAACGSKTTPTPAPTEPPPTAEPPTEPAGGGIDSDIVGITWQWAELTETAPASQSVVPDPQNYTLMLKPDGEVSIKADCNMVGGTYTLEGASLTIALGPSTMAYCGDDSLDQQYLALIGDVVTFVMHEGNLVLNLKMDAGDMTFAPAKAGSEITGITWQWAELIETAPASQSVVPAPENYTLVFQPDGKFYIKADCNLGSGIYTVEGNSLTLELGPLTRAYCGDDSLHDQYLQLLGQVASYELKDGCLALHLADDAGQMVFDNGGPAE